MEIVSALENHLVFYIILFLSSFGLLFSFYHSKFFSTLDVPNHRSMHEYPVKKSAGLVFISLFILSIFYIVFFSGKNVQDLNLLYRTVPGLLVCLGIGFLDDRYNYSSRKKLFLEIVFFLPYTFYFFPEFELFGIYPNVPKIFSSIFLSIYIIFVLNLCNFMDGLDMYLTLSVFTGILNFILIINGIPENTYILLFALLASLASFLFFNYPPARLFMGDTGSLPLGYVIAILPFLGNPEKVMDLSYGFLFIPVFWVDGVLTILRRIFKKENILSAHREHLYQKLTIHSWDKRLTSITFSAWNLLSIPIFYFLKSSLPLLFLVTIVFIINGFIYFILMKKINA